MMGQYIKLLKKTETFKTKLFERKIATHDSKFQTHFFNNASNLSHLENRKNSFCSSNHDQKL